MYSEGSFGRVSRVEEAWECSDTWYHPARIRFWLLQMRPRKDGSHSKNFGQLEKHNINRCFPLISVIIASKFEETLITNSKRPDQPAHQLLSSSTVSTAILEIRINGLDFPLATSTKSNQRHQRGFHPLLSSRLWQAKERGSGIWMEMIWLLLRQLIGWSPSCRSKFCHLLCEVLLSHHVPYLPLHLMEEGKVEKMVAKLPLPESLFGTKHQSSRWACYKASVFGTTLRRWERLLGGSLR